MSLLRIHVTPSWADAEPEVPLPWCRIGARGEALDSGEAAVSALPAADACELIVPAELVLLTKARLPHGRKEKLRPLLPYAIEDKLGADPDSVHVAAGPLLGDGQTVLAVVDKAWLTTVFVRLAAFGVAPRSAWPEILLPALRADTWTLVWDGRGGFVRSSAHTGVRVDATSDDAPPAALRLSVDEARRAGTVPSRLVLRLADGAPRPDTEAWSRTLGVVIEVGAPWAPLTAPEAATGGVNLLQGAFAHPGPARKWGPALSLPLALAGLVVFVHVAGTASEWLLMKREQATLRASMVQQFRVAFPGAAVSDAPLQMQRNVADLRRAAGEASPLDFVPLLARAAAALDGSTRSQLRGVGYEASTLVLEIDIPERSAADALVRRLAGGGLVARVEGGDETRRRVVITGTTR
jgi:general secretion pathway protein L